jgi:hypothetical protein
MECIIKQDPEFCSSTNILINLTSGKPDLSRWDLILQINNRLFSGNDRSRLIAILNHISRAVFTNILIKILESLLNSVTLRPNIYYQNLLNPLVNGLYFSATIQWDGRYIVEEGVANYYEYFKFNKRAKFLFAFKRVVFWLFGVKMRGINTLTGIDEKLTVAQYVYRPEYTLYPAKSRAILRAQSSYIPDGSVILIIGQEAGLRGNSLKMYCGFVNRIILLMRRRFNGAEIKYKPHWDTDNNINDALLGPVEFINDYDRVESIVHKVKPRVIVSFASSALVNIALEYNEMVERSVLEIYYNRSFNPPIEIIELFEKVGIKHLDINKLGK